MGKLIVISNRVAIPEQGKQSSGGLAVAVLDALKRQGGVWFGWSGEITQTPENDVKTFDIGHVAYAVMDLSPRDVDEYYNGFANSTLWPLFHYRIDLAEFTRRTYRGYQRVTSLFATRVAPFIEPDDLIWIHDYHLIPVAECLRQMGFQNRMGFFLHTPFPPPEILVTLPNHSSLARALCAYDVLGFQVQTDVRAFADYIRYEAPGQADQRADGRYDIQSYGRQLVAGAFPISIDVDAMQMMAAASATARQTQRLRESILGRDLIIGVDRLDYSKGLANRFSAYDTLLGNYPANRGRVTFMQIAPPTREDVKEYQDIRAELEQLAGHINGRYAEFDWVPIRYLNKSFSRKTLAGFFRVARIGLVTPLRDGMNLVAKEFIASQDPTDPGVLVLSRFAGAARELDAALIVNPFDVEGVAETLQTALSMPADERKARHASLMTALEGNDIVAWREAFLHALKSPPSEIARPAA